MTLAVHVRWIAKQKEEKKGEEREKRQLHIVILFEETQKKEKRRKTTILKRTSLFQENQLTMFSFFFMRIEKQVENFSKKRN